MTADLARGPVPPLEIDDPVPFRLVLVAVIVGWMLSVRLRVFEQVLRVSVLDEVCVEKLFWIERTDLDDRCVSSSSVCVARFVTSRSLEAGPLVRCLVDAAVGSRGGSSAVLAWWLVALMLLTRIW